MDDFLEYITYKNIIEESKKGLHGMLDVPIELLSEDELNKMIKKGMIIGHDAGQLIFETLIDRVGEIIKGVWENDPKLITFGDTVTTFNKKHRYLVGSCKLVVTAEYECDEGHVMDGYILIKQSGFVRSIQRAYGDGGIVISEVLDKIKLLDEYNITIKDGVTGEIISECTLKTRDETILTGYLANKDTWETVVEKLRVEVNRYCKTLISILDEAVSFDNNEEILKVLSNSIQNELKKLG